MSNLVCGACKATSPIPESFWDGLFFRLFSTHRGRNAVSLNLASTFTTELPLYARFTLGAPTCAASLLAGSSQAPCQAPIDLRGCPPGTDGVVPCSACGAVMRTFPAPPLLRTRFPDVLQFFGATRGDEPPMAPTPTPNDAAPRPVTFSCPDCGGHLKLTTDAPRILDCRFCRASVFLPDALWFALHPVQKRRPWWVAVAR